MKRGMFLDQPAAHMVTPRIKQTPAQYANPWEHEKRKMDWQDKLVIVGSVIAAAAALAMLFAPLPL